MPIKKAGIKAIRTSKTNRIANILKKENLKKALKNANSKNLDVAFKAIDKATKSYLLHPNKANRMKSQLSKKFTSKTETDTKTVKPAKSLKPVKKSLTKSVKKNSKK